MLCFTPKEAHRKLSKIPRKEVVLYVGKSSKTNLKLQKGGNKMKKIHVYLITVLILMGATSVWGATDVAEEIYFEKSTTLTPATYTFEFSLYSAQTGGTQTWLEEKSIDLTDDTIKTYLGDTNPLSGVNFAKQWWVRVRKRNTDGTYQLIGSPARTRLNMVPYAAWTINGITGPQGPEGPQGPQGPPGPANSIAFCVCAAENNVQCSCNQTTVSKTYGPAEDIFCDAYADAGHCYCNKLGYAPFQTNSCCVCR
jgi:hypothetical protein